MADIRCPMCGKTTPADSEICRHCGAQIQPKHLPDFGEETSAPDDQISWLRDLQGDAAPPDADDADVSPDAPPEDDGEMPDWLTRIRERSRFEEQNAARAVVDQNKPVEHKAEEPAADWAENDDLSEGQRGNAVDEAQDWLGNLRNIQTPTDQPDRLEESRPEGETELPLEDEADGEVMERLSALATGPLSAGTEEEPLESSLNFSAIEIPQEEDTLADAPQEDLQAWLDKLDAARPSPETVEDKAAIHDWLNDRAVEEPSAPEVEPDFGEDIPAWMRADPETPMPLETLNTGTPDSAGLEPAEELPEWLHPPQAESPAPSPLGETEPAAEETPDWLTEIADEVFEETPAEEMEGGDALDWLNSVESEEDTLENADLTPSRLTGLETGLEGDALPEADLSEETLFEPKDSAPGFEGDLEEQLLADGALFADLPPEAESGEEGDEAISETFSENGETAAPQYQMPFEIEDVLPEEEGVSPFLKDDLPDWLSEAHAKTLAGADEGSVPAFTLETTQKNKNADSSSPFAGEDVPEWLSKDAGLADMEGALQEAGEEGEIAPAQMPSWLQAMRPVEAVAPGKARPHTSTEAEKAGPLAGLQGILPAEDLATQYRKPPVYSTKLRMNESQKTHADLFEQILQQENGPKAVSRERVQAPHWLIRLVIAVLMISVLVLPLLASPVSIPLALSSPPAPVLDFYQELEVLPDGAPVLIAFDYDPGFAAEMRFSAIGALAHLLSKRAQVAAISTVPQGPVLAEDLIRQAQKRAEQSQPGFMAGTSSDFINLGYLAGGLVSLQEFSTRPSLAVQSGFDGLSDGGTVWAKPAQWGVNALADFALVLVLTEDVDTGRAWVEQVQPALGSTPMVMVTSTQASPMLMPYVQSGQLKGLISGLGGGMAYERMAGFSGSSRSHFHAYQYAMILGVAFVLLGLFFKILVSLFARRKATSEA